MRKMRILAVDDNTVNLATIEQELKGKYEVIPMISGRRAIKYLYVESVDLILLDVQMPLMDGIQTLTEIRNMEKGTTVPVIFLTSLKDKDTVVAGSKLGIMDYITKPFDTVDLVNRIDMVFKRLGILPIEDTELLASVREILKDITTGKAKPAIIKIDEVLRYQVDEEISGRIRNARTKLEKEDITGAGNVVLRVIRMLEKKMGMDTEQEMLEINNRELCVKLLYIQDNLQNFNTKEALERCHELTKYGLEEDMSVALKRVIDCLVQYDDDEAESIIKEMVEELNKI